MDKDFEESGYAIVPLALQSNEVDRIELALDEVALTKAGTRNLLEAEWCRALAQRLRTLPELAQYVPSSSVAIQCTLFDKNADANWLVALHQDLSVPVRAPVSHPDLKTWSRKEGQNFVQPPVDLLNQLVAVRIHIDDCGPTNGPLRVVPGSHREGRLESSSAHRLREQTGEIACIVGRGGALVLRPLLLHASSKAVSANRRRVLHFLFGPRQVGYGLEWQTAA